MNFIQNNRFNFTKNSFQSNNNYTQAYNKILEILNKDPDAAAKYLHYEKSKFDQDQSLNPSLQVLKKIS